MKFAKPRRSVNRVFIHCSASDNPAHDSAAVIKKWHTDRVPHGRGWSDIGYHFFIRKDGTVESGRPLEKSPAAQVHNNIGTIAICCHGLDEDKFTEAQFDALRDLCVQIYDAYYGRVTFHGHREVANKSCPVFDYKRVLDLDANGNLGHGAAKVTPPQSTPQPRRGSAKDFVKAFQKHHGLVVDGIPGPITFGKLFE